MFASVARGRFMTSKRKCSAKLMVDGKMVNQPEALSWMWAQHFGKLAKSKVNDSEGLQGLSCEMDKLASRSVSNEEFVLDVPFSVEEAVTAVRKLKGSKAVASFPGLPRFSFSVCVQYNTRKQKSAKNGDGLVSFIT